MPFYEKGMLKPLQPLDLAENERVVVSITQKANGAGLGQLDADFVEGLRRRLAGAAPAPAWKRCGEGSLKSQAR